MEVEVIPFFVLLTKGLTDEEKIKHCLGPTKQRLTKSLFYDFDTSRDKALYTLWDCRPTYYRIINGIPRYDMRQLYLGVDDITEYQFINKFLYDKDQWEKLQLNNFVLNHITEWRKEQRLKVKSDMFNVLLEDATDKQSKTKTSSAKYLLEKYYDPTTKNEKQGKRAREEDNKLILADKERILEGFQIN